MTNDTGRPETTNEAYAQREAELAELHARIEEVIGQERHYGIRVWQETDPERPWARWFTTDAYLDLERYAFAHYADTPPAVTVYTRDQYERACAAVGLTPAEDADLGTYADRFMPPTLWDLYPLAHVEAQLRVRRLSGLERETAPARKAAEDARRQAERQAYEERVRAAEAAGRRCDECGTLIVTGGMNASLGLSCSNLDCYEALTDRPGRFATRGK
jgi:hypothetical protein